MDYLLFGVLIGLTVLFLIASRPQRFRAEHSTKLFYYVIAIWFALVLYLGFKSNVLPQKHFFVGLTLTAPLIVLLFQVHLNYLRSLHKSEVLVHDHRRILDAVDISIFRLNQEGRLTSANRKGLEVIGTSWHRAENMFLSELVRVDDIEPLRESFYECIETLEPTRVSFQFVSLREEINFVTVDLIPFKSHNDVVYVDGLVVDETQEHFARNQACFLGNVVTGSSAPILVCNDFGEILVWNRGMELLTGIGVGQTVGQHYDQVFPSLPDLVLETAIQGGKFNCETELYRRQKKVIVSLHVYKVEQDDDTTAYAVFFQDLTEQRVLEERVKQQDRIKAVGTMANGIAHDFNNLLTVISGNAFLLSSYPDLPESLRTVVKAILRSAQRGSELTENLLSFSRGQRIEPQQVQVVAILNEVLQLLEHANWEKIKFKKLLEPDLPDIWADSNSLQRAIMNLCVNARDAMPGGGTITLRCEKQYITDLKRLTTGGVSDPGKYIVISVEDSGTGIQKEVLDRIFEPYYSTKSSLKGTGLGLANVHGIVQQHHGWIEVNSELKKGSCFSIFLPVFHEPVNTEHYEKTKSQPGSSTEMMRGGETILLRIEEPQDRRYLKQTLLYFGYELVEATTEEDVCEKLDSDTNPVSIVMMDVRASEDLKATFIERRVPVLMLISSDAERGDYPEEWVRFVHKPMKTDVILKSLRHLLKKADSEQKA